MRLFISAGEPSGDLHGGSLVQAVRRLAPHVEFTGFGGPHMAAAGCPLLYPLSTRAFMGIVPVLAHVPEFLGLLSWTDRYFARQRPDAVVLIDYPAFHWWVARRAHARGIPVFYFVPPQIWAWASWRVRNMRRWVDHVLCSLPFEVPWYAERGVTAHYVGHPYFDELARQRPDPLFVAEQQAQGKTIIGLLPGSRTQEVQRNLSTLVRTAGRIYAARPDARFLVACYRPDHLQFVESYLRRKPPLPITAYVGKTPEIIHLAHSCVAVSGSVGLELLCQRKPTVVVYRVHAIEKRFVRWFVKCRYISLVNLLAGQELFPEYLSVSCQAAAISQHILTWLNHPAVYQAQRQQLSTLCHEVAVPGACERSAHYLLEQLGVALPDAARQAA
ncbi:MAG: lipid-A-disaccharide synthase [Gemmataceae bacterium]